LQETAPGGLLGDVIFLPLVERELRVAARKRSTFWVRIAAALAALLIGSGFLVLTLVGLGFRAPSLGSGLFGVLTWLSLAAVLSAGLFFTSDCLSEEKREGTLGFLFLTNLRGYDVVLGKLLAMSLRGFYALLAVFPILAITLLMGGVTGGAFWKTSLALVNALFISLAAGLFVSAVSHEAQKALAATLLLLLVLVVGGPVCDAALAAIGQHPFNPLLSLSSPGYLFVTADAWGRTPFWMALVVNQVVGWMLLGLACLLIPHTWQEKVVRNPAAGAGWAHWFKYGGVRRQSALRARLMSVNPVLWLACRERWQAFVLWGVAIAMAGGITAMLAIDEQIVWWVAWSYLGGFFTLLLYLGVASQAGRFLVDARRSGLIELLLATPLTERQIVQGQWRGLVRMFGLPLALCLAVHLLGSFMSQQAWRGLAATVTTTGPAVTTATTAPAVTNTIIVTAGAAAASTVGVLGAPNHLIIMTTSVAGTLAVAANFVALVWFGMWMGLNSRNTSLATLKTILFVQIIPWFVAFFVSSLIVPLLLLCNLIQTKTLTAPAPAFMAWYPLLTAGLATVLSLIKDIAFFLWARRKLYSEFRERAARTGVSTMITLPLPLPAAKAPPILSPTESCRQ
jgi:hypothetical protein